MSLSVYIDGFNLYYGAVKGTRLHWLNIHAMSTLLFPHFQVGTIRYFTAIVSGRADDPDKPVRQQIYLRALATVPSVSVHLGSFLTTKVMMPLADPKPDGPRTVRVIKTEEKGSDVNLASHLLHDAHLGRFDAAVVISNDSDLLEPIRLVRQHFGARVGVVNPRGRQPSKELLRECDFVKELRSGVLAAAQFPEHLTDARGSFNNPYRSRYEDARP